MFQYSVEDLCKCHASPTGRNLLSASILLLRLALHSCVFYTAWVNRADFLMFLKGPLGPTPINLLAFGQRKPIDRDGADNCLRKIRN
jgi:hypothetical protein